MAPLTVHGRGECVIREINAAGITTLLVEQNLYSGFAGDRCYIIDQGEIEFKALRSGPADEELRRRYLHV